jgi:hypothetical protein
MTEHDPARAAYEAEQAEAKSEMQSETEYQDWLRGWKKQDLEADLVYNQSRTLNMAAGTEYMHAKAAFWSGLTVLLGVIIVILVAAAIIAGIKVIW